MYIQNSPIIISDKNKKNSIEDLSTKYISMIDYLSPKRYKLNDGQSNRYHIGFIAQDVKDAMDFAEIDSLEFGGWIKDVDSDGNEIYMLRYEEFIGILHEKNKQLDKKLKEVVLEVEDLKGKIEKLEKRL
jgi:hypothetical protein